MVVTKAIYPQLMKAEGSGDRKKMLRLSMISTSVPFILMTLLSVPIIIEIDFILKVWLKDVPQYTPGFAILLILLTLTTMLSSGIGTAISSIGKIKAYQFVTGTLLLLGLPLAIIFFKFGFSLYWSVIIAIIIEAIIHIVRLFFLKRIAFVPIKNILINVDLKLILILIIGYLSSSWLIFFINPGVFRLILVSIISTIFIILGTYFILLNSDEKTQVNIYFSKLIKTKK